MITKETSPVLRARKQELARLRAIEGIDEAAIEAGLIPRNASGEGWKAVVRHVTATLLKSSNLRGQAEAAAFLGKASGNTTPEPQQTVIFAEVLVGLLNKHLGQVVEGEVADESV